MFWLLVLLKAIGVQPLDQWSWWWFVGYMAFEIVCAIAFAAWRGPR